jgi:hypothetical protein
MSTSLVLLGGLTGLHAATWGAFKDTPFEGFRRRSFARSIILGAAVALALGASHPHGQTLVLVGLLYAGERLVTEWWKSFLREDSQAAYAIPMRMAVGGRPVDARLPRYATGAAVLLGLGVSAVVLRPFDGSALPGWAMVLVGGTGGWLTAVGGAWKDAPVEGFSGWKFLRSPAVATLWAAVLTPLSDSLWALAVSAGGLSVLVIETYKTFLTGGRPPGKFAGKPVRFVQRATRQSCRLLHCLAYGALAGLVLASPTAAVTVAAAVGVVLVAARNLKSVDATTTREPGVGVGPRAT